MRRKIVIAVASLCLLLLTTLAQGQRQAEFRGFGDELPPAQLELPDLPMAGMSALAGQPLPGAVTLQPPWADTQQGWPGLAETPQPPWGDAQQGWPEQAQLPDQQWGGGQQPWPALSQMPQQPFGNVQQGWADQAQLREQPFYGGQQPWPSQAQAGQQPMANAVGFQGFADGLPPAPIEQAGVPSIPGATTNMQGTDVNALMSLMGSAQGQTGQAGGIDMTALLAAAAQMQGQAGDGNATGQADPNQALQLLSAMYGVSSPEQIDAALIQQGIRNLQEMQTWEGMEGIDFGPLIQMLQGNAAQGQAPQIDPGTTRQLFDEE